MTKLRVKNLSQVEASIKRDIKKALRDKDVREGIGEIVVEEIRAEKFPVTSKSTKSWRKYLEQGNKPLHKDYDPSSINFTFTGELLNDLKTNIKARFTKDKVEFVIEHSDKKHKKYKKPDGRPLKGVKQAYSKIYEYLNLIGYRYLILSKKSEKRVLKFIKEELFKRLK